MCLDRSKASLDVAGLALPVWILCGGVGEEVLKGCGANLPSGDNSKRVFSPRAQKWEGLCGELYQTKGEAPSASLQTQPHLFPAASRGP